MRIETCLLDFLKKKKKVKQWFILFFQAVFHLLSLDPTNKEVQVNSKELLLTEVNSRLVIIVSFMKSFLFGLRWYFQDEVYN